MNGGCCGCPTGPYAHAKQSPGCTLDTPHAAHNGKTPRTARGGQEGQQLHDRNQSRGCADVEHEIRRWALHLQPDDTSSGSPDRFLSRKQQTSRSLPEQKAHARSTPVASECDAHSAPFVYASLVPHCDIVLSEHGDACVAFVFVRHARDPAQRPGGLGMILQIREPRSLSWPPGDPYLRRTRKVSAGNAPLS